MKCWRDPFNATSMCCSRSDQHLFRDQCLGRGGGRQASQASRDKRRLPAGDCTGGHPGRSALAYEVLPGNTADCTTLRMFLAVSSGTQPCGASG